MTENKKISIFREWLDDRKRIYATSQCHDAVIVLNSIISMYDAIFDCNTDETDSQEPLQRDNTGRKKVDNTNKVKPKFNVGDWVMLDRPVLITNVEDMPYNTHQYWTSDGTWFGDATKSKLWTIEDAKDGDVLLSKHNQPFIYNGVFNDESVGAYCGLDSLGTAFLEAILPCNWSSKEGVEPATKEQRALLFEKMREAGYAWDADKNELKKKLQ